MYRGTEVVGVFDWEMVSLGNAESDLGWWLFLQRYHTEGVGQSILEGMLTREETVAVWERHVGRPATHVDFYECLGGFHFSLVMIRLAHAFGTPDMAVHNPVAAITLRLLGLPAV
jgi:aminoglycoside phosphotransferase (APT) family kinase protein